MKKFLPGLLVLLYLLATPPPVRAQTTFLRPGEVKPVSVAVGADDLNEAFILKYHGPAAGGYVTVSAAGDILFEVGDTSTADTTLECDASIAASGARNGTYDVSTAPCDTVGEVCDLVNAQSQYWTCVPLDAFRSDTPGPSGTGFILAVTNAVAKSEDGYKVKWDTSAALTSTIALLPPPLRKANAYFQVSYAGTRIWNPTPFYGQQTTFYLGNVTSTYASGTSLSSFYSVAWDGPAGETVTTLYAGAANAATTVQKEFSFTYGFVGLPNEKFIWRATNSAAMASTTHYAYGKLTSP